MTTIEELIAPAGKKKGKKAKAAKEPKAPKEPKEPRATSITHQPGDLLVAQLGTRAADYLTLSTLDAELETDALNAKRDGFVDRMNDPDAIADKVREKMIMAIMFAADGGALNEVLKRTLTVLAADGHLTSGEKGNLQVNLLAKPYSKGTAASQSNQMFMALPELDICIKEKGRMVANPDSTLLMAMNARLGL